MGYVVRMPQLGMTMEEGVVIEWPTGDDPFEEGDIVAVIESEKTTNEIAARESGVVLERFVDLEEPVAPGTPIAYIGEPGSEVPEDVKAEAAEAIDGTRVDSDDSTATSGSSGSSALDAARSEASEGQPADVGEEQPADAGEEQPVDAGDRNVSPRARTYANEHGIDAEALRTLEGTGPDGAVIERDVIDAHQRGTFEAEPDVGRASTAVGRNIYEEREGSRLRQSVARRMTASAREAPQVTLNRTVPVDALLDVKAGLESDLGIDLSIADLLVKAVANALEAHPAFNAVYEDGVHRLAGNVNVSVAIDLDDGLVTPVIRNVDERSLQEIAAERTSLVDRVRSREYTGDDLADGTFTITNLGHFGVESFDPLLNVPQVGTLGVGSIRTRHTPDGDGTERVIGLSLTFDHRPNDGADAALFLDTIAEELTHPFRLLSIGGDTSVDNTDEAADGPFRERADPIEGPRRAQAVSTEGLSATLRSRRFEWRADEPEDAGGDDTAPTPVEQFLGSLAACLSLMIREIAARRDVELGRIDVTVDADPDHGALESIDTDVTISSSADPEDVERVVETAERACYVSRAIDDDVDRSLSIDIEPPA